MKVLDVFNSNFAVGKWQLPAGPQCPNFLTNDATGYC